MRMYVFCLGSYADRFFCSICQVLIIRRFGWTQSSRMSDLVQPGVICVYKWNAPLLIRNQSVGSISVRTVHSACHEYNMTYVCSDRHEYNVMKWK